MNIWKKVFLQSFLFVGIGDDTSNKIFVLWGEEEKLTIWLFVYWTQFSKILIKVRCLCKLLLNQTSPLSELQKKITLQKNCRKSLIHSPTSRFGQLFLRHSEDCLCNFFLRMVRWLVFQKLPGNLLQCSAILTDLFKSLKWFFSGCSFSL